MSLIKCRLILEKDGSRYSDEEVLEIREFLYMLAELDYEVYLSRKVKEKNQKDRNDDNESFKEAA
ncbi:MAG TPA: hypothetical protein VFM99_03870 [Chitinophagales bacterium]|nr:hypothetical protein [Chitinophagales bacterium]